jgi:hypothetical protein
MAAGHNTYRERTGSVTGSSPTPATVQAEALISHNLQNTAAAEGLGVCLTLDLENIEREEDNLADTDQTR